MNSHEEHKQLPHLMLAPPTGGWMMARGLYVALATFHWEHTSGQFRVVLVHVGIFGLITIFTHLMKNKQSSTLVRSDWCSSTSRSFVCFGIYRKHCKLPHFDKLCISIPEILQRKHGELTYLTEYVFLTETWCYKSFFSGNGGNMKMQKRWKCQSWVFWLVFKRKAFQGLFRAYLGKRVGWFVSGWKWRSDPRKGVQC